MNFFKVSYTQAFQTPEENFSSFILILAHFDF